MSQLSIYCLLASNSCFSISSSIMEPALEAFSPLQGVPPLALPQEGGGGTFRRTRASLLSSNAVFGVLGSCYISGQWCRCEDIWWFFLFKKVNAS